MNNTQKEDILIFFSRILLILCLSSVCSISVAQPIKDWDKGYGGEGYEDCNAAVQTNDLGYLLGGVTDSDPSGDIADTSQDFSTLPWWIPNQIGDFWAVRTDVEGELIWESRFGGNLEDRMWAILETDDGGALLGGVSYSDSTGDRTQPSRGHSDYWIVKTDALGEKEWDRAYGGDSTDVLNVMIKTLDGGYILGGWSLSTGWTVADSTGEKSEPSRGGFDWWVVKIDAIGDVQWERTYGGDGLEELSDIVQKDDGTYLIAGGTRSSVSGDVDSLSRGDGDFWLLQVDESGNKIKEYRYGGNEYDYINRIIVTSDSSYVLAGSSYTMVPSGDKTDPGFAIFDWWVMKIDTTGTILWQHTFGGSDIENVYSLSQNSVDHYLLGGFTRSNDGTLADNVTKGANDFWIMYLDPDGNLIWDELYGGNESESLEQLFQTNDGGYLLTGHSRTDVDQDKTDPTEGNNDFWIVKTLCNVNVSLNDTIVCPGDSLLLNVYDANCADCIYSWSDNLMSNDSIRLIITDEAVTYGITLTDGVGCQRSDEITIDVHVPPTVDLGNDVLICHGDTHTFNAENAGLDFLWNTSEVNQTIDVQYPGNYEVTVTDAIGCEVVDNINLSLSNLQAYVITTNVSCGETNGTATVVATGGTGNYSYDWTIGGSSNQLNNLSAGTYNVVVSDGDCSVVVEGVVGFEEAPVIEWEQNYGGSLFDNLNDIKETPDGGYIVIGATESSDIDLSGNFGGMDLWVKKLNAAGVIEWQRNYGGTMHDEGVEVVVDETGGYTITGFSNSNDGEVGANNGGYDVWVLKIDNLGTIIWSQTFGGSGDDKGVSIEQTLEGGYILGNVSDSNDEDISNPIGGDDLWVLKITANGNVEWENSYGGVNDDAISKIKQTIDGGYFVSGFTASNFPSNNGLLDIYVLKIDPRGETEWLYNYGGSDDEMISDFAPSPDGGFMLLGRTSSFDGDVVNLNGSTEIWVVKVNNLGAFEWQRTIGGSLAEFGLSIDRIGDGNYVIVGNSSSTDGDIAGNYGSEDIVFIKIDDTANPIWSQHYGTSTYDLACEVFQTNDGGFIIGGTISGADNDVSNYYGGTDEWIVKLNTPPLPVVVLPNDITSCAFDSVTFAPTINNCSNCSWQWLDGPLDSLRTETPSVTTIYEMIITDENGCTSSDQMTVNVNALPIVDLGNNTSICIGTSIPLDAGTDGNVYSWSTNEATQIINIDTTGTYAVTVTDANSCSAQDSMLLTVNELPMVDLGVDTSFCEGQTYTLDAGNPGANYQWSSIGGNVQTITVSDAGDYGVTVTDVNNCSAEDIVTVSYGLLPEQVSIDLLDPGPFCPGTSFSITIPNSQNGILYELFDGNNISGGSQLGTGGAVSIATDAIYNSTTFNIVASFGGMCPDTLSATTTANIGDNESPIIDCRADTVIMIEDGNCNPVLAVGAPITVSDNCAIESVIYTLSGVTNVSSPATGINDASGENFNIGLTTVTYTAIDSFGNASWCTFTVDVIDMTEPLAGTPASDMIVECDGAGNATAFNNWLVNNGGATAFDSCSDLVWTTIPANPTISDGCGETGSVEVTFVASDTSGNAITSIATFTIEDTQAPEFTVPADITIGPLDDPFDLTITGDVIDEFDNCDGGVSDQGPRFATFVDAIVTDDCADVITRTWTLSDECGNTSQEVQSIRQEFNPPSGSISGAINICAGEMVDLTFNLAGASNLFNVIYTDNIIGGNITLAGISDGHIIQVMPMETTIYSIVSVVDVTRLDCEGMIGNNVEIIVNEAPTAINIVETCDLLNTSYVVTFEITGGDNSSYMVSGDGGVLTNGDFVSLSIPRDSTYTFFIEDANGCGMTEITGSYDCECTTDAGNFQDASLSVCADEVLNAEHIGSTLDGNDIIEFIVHDGDANTIGPNIFYTSNTPDFSFQTGMMYGVTYYVTVIAGTDDGTGEVADVDACYSESLGIPIVFNEAPTAVITPVTDTELDCIETSIYLSAGLSQTQGSITYEWTIEGMGNYIDSTFDLVEVDEIGTYVLTISDGATGCTATTSINITIDEDVPVAVIADPASLTCDDLTVQLNGAGSSVGNNFTYQWSGGSIESGGQTLTPIVSMSAMYTLVVTNTLNGCTEDAEIFVDSDTDPPIVNAGSTQQLDCITTELTLNGTYTAPTNNVSIQWIANPGNIVSGENTFTPIVDAGGTYTLIVTNEDNGCSGESSVSITVDPSTPQGATLEAINPECYGDENGSISIIEVEGGTGPFTYSLDGQNFYDLNEFDNLAPGQYNLTVQDAIGCEWDTTVSLDYPTELVVDLGDNVEIQLGDSIQLDAFVNQPIDTFVWNFPEIISMSPFVQPANETTYTIQVTNSDGCQDEDFVSIVVRKDRNVYIPTAFSPNGDGANDYFAIYSDQSVVNIKNFRIFDRWGETLFAAENILPNAELQGWDGSFKGKSMQQGVFVYFAEIEFFDGRVEIFKGDVTLVK